MKKLILIIILLFGLLSYGQIIGVVASSATQNPNIVSNGTFDSGTDWSLAAGWAIGTGTLNGTATETLASQNSPAIAPVDTVTYDFSFDVTSYTSGDLRIRVGGTSSSVVTISGTGNYTGSVVSGADGEIKVDDGATGAFTGSIDNLEIREQ